MAVSVRRRSRNRRNVQRLAVGPKTGIVCTYNHCAIGPTKSPILSTELEHMPLCAWVFDAGDHPQGTAAARGEVLGLVGESSSGKSTLGKPILNLVQPTSGRIRFDGNGILRLKGGERQRIRRRMQIIFQDPYAALSPRAQIKQIIAEPIRLHRWALA